MNQQILLKECLFSVALGFVAVRTLSGCSESGLLFSAGRRLLILAASLGVELRLQSAGSVLVAQGLSFPTACGAREDRTRVCCIGRQSLTCWTTKKVPAADFWQPYLFFLRQTPACLSSVGSITGSSWTPSYTDTQPASQPWWWSSTTLNTGVWGHTVYLSFITFWLHEIIILFSTFAL